MVFFGSRVNVDLVPKFHVALRMMDETEIQLGSIPGYCSTSRGEKILLFNVIILEDSNFTEMNRSKG